MYICIVMAKEIEKKFIVTGTDYRNEAFKSTEIVQGYISSDPKRTVRVRVKGEEAFLTVKGLNTGMVRDEWEYPIPISDAREMLVKLCDKVISKIRYEVSHGGLVWEIDEFQGKLSGLVIAEVELPSADSRIVTYPHFVGMDVTGDKRYYNSNLVSLDCPPE